MATKIIKNADREMEMLIKMADNKAFIKIRIAMKPEKVKS